MEHAHFEECPGMQTCPSSSAHTDGKERATCQPKNAGFPQGALSQQSNTAHIDGKSPTINRSTTPRTVQSVCVSQVVRASPGCCCLVSWVFCCNVDDACLRASLPVLSACLLIPAHAGMLRSTKLHIRFPSSIKPTWKPLTVWHTLSPHYGGKP